MHARSVATAFLTLAIAALAVPAGIAGAQRRPGVGEGFFTTTGLLTLDVEAGSVTSTTARAEAPTVAASALLTAPLVKQRKQAWIVGVRGTFISFGNNKGCYVVLGEQGCRDRRYTERVSALVGGAFDIRSTILRLTAGPVLYDVEETGARVGTQVRLDFGSPRLSGPTPTLFLSRSFMGSQDGRGVGLTTLGASMRWVRKK